MENGEYRGLGEIVRSNEHRAELIKKNEMETAIYVYIYICVCVNIYMIHTGRLPKKWR